jgi:hypothetical protein
MLLFAQILSSLPQNEAFSSHQAVP